MTPETVLPEPPLPSGLLAGITYSSETGLLVLVGPGFPLGPDFLTLGNTSIVLGPYSPLDTLDLTLESASAIGLDVFPVSRRSNGRCSDLRLRFGFSELVIHAPPALFAISQPRDLLFPQFLTC
jgi:hypothetical protein